VRTKSPDIPWKRIFVEGSAIVISILLAFSIDTWWDNRQDREEEKRILAGIKTELENNLSLIENEIAYRNAVVASILKIFDASAGKIELTSDEFDRLLGDVTWWANVDYSRGLIDGLVQSGRLTLIENKKLRDAIASLPNRYDVIRESEQNDQKVTRDIVVPYINAHPALTQIANTMADGRPGTGDAPTPPMHPVFNIRDHRELLQDTEFLGIVVQEHWNHVQVISDYEPFKALIEKILRQIESVLTEESGWEIGSHG